MIESGVLFNILGVRNQVFEMFEYKSKVHMASFRVNQLMIVVLN